MKKVIAFIVSMVFISSAFFSVGVINAEAAAYEEAPSITEHQVIKKIDTLISLLDGKYFTTTGSSCWNSSCNKCLNANVFNSSWFKNMFGKVSVNQLPGHAYPGGDTGYAYGWSCHGFANFAMWYIFASDNSDKVDFKRVVDYVALTEENVKKYAKPGDIIRYKNNSVGHSVIFVSADEEGITVLDSNYRYISDGHCRVRLHKIKYTGTTMAISRATNYIDTPSLTLNFDTNGGAILNSTPKGYAYEVVYSKGLNLRAGTSSGYKRLTVIPEGEVFTVDFGNTVQANGYTWGKVTYGGYTGWAVISETEYTKLVGEVMNTPYFVKDGIVYSSETAKSFAQNVLYDGTQFSLVDSEALGLVKDGYYFVGWSMNKDAGDVIKTDSVICADDIAECADNKDKTVTLYAVWEPVHVHSFPAWTHTGNESSHTAVCGCGYATIEEHEWIENTENVENEKHYHCNGCGINKTVNTLTGSYTIDGTFYIGEEPERNSGWFLVNGNKILSYTPIWRSGF